METKINIYRLIKCVYLLVPFGLCFELRSQNLAQKLGYPQDARLLIVHADDLGVSHSENSASISALEFGVVNSASVMVPCPWFSEIAEYARNHPEMDFGIHLTLNSEWPNYKWRPTEDLAKVPGLIDDRGYLHESWEGLLAYSNPTEIEREFRAQIEHALKSGFQPSHLDAHMFSVFADSRFVEVYKKLGREYEIPVLLDRRWSAMRGTNPDDYIGPEDIVIDSLYMALPDDYRQGLANYYSRILRKLKPGLNVILLHAAYDNEEMRAITAGIEDFGSKWRQQDFDFWTSEICRQIISEEKIQLVQWKDIKMLISND